MRPCERDRNEMVRKAEGEREREGRRERKRKRGRNRRERQVERVQSLGEGRHVEGSGSSWRLCAFFPGSCPQPGADPKGTAPRVGP